MAILSNDIYVADIRLNVNILDRDFSYLNTKPTITLKSLDTFKASSESTFFGAYNSNSSVKSNVYNKLRADMFSLLPSLRTNMSTLQDVHWMAAVNPVVRTALLPRINEIIDFNSNVGYTTTKNLLQKIYGFNGIVTKLYLPAKFNDATLTATFDYKSNYDNNRPVYNVSNTLQHGP